MKSHNRTGEGLLYHHHNFQSNIVLYTKDLNCFVYKHYKMNLVSFTPLQSVDDSVDVLLLPLKSIYQLVILATESKESAVYCCITFWRVLLLNVKILLWIQKRTFTACSNQVFNSCTFFVNPETAYGVQNIKIGTWYMKVLSISLCWLECVCQKQ